MKDKLSLKWSPGCQVQTLLCHNMTPLGSFSLSHSTFEVSLDTFNFSQNNQSLYSTLIAQATLAVYKC